MQSRREPEKNRANRDKGRRQEERVTGHLKKCGCTNLLAECRGQSCQQPPSGRALSASVA